MLKLIESIEEALEKECYLPALYMALTLPDICGRVAYLSKGLEIKQCEVGKRYKEWYHDNFFKDAKDMYKKLHKENPKLWSSYDNLQLKFDESACYKLRCAILHEGSFDLSTEMNGIEFSLCTKRAGSIGIIEGNSFGETYTKKLITVQIEELCKDLCRASRKFYKEVENKNLFSFSNIHLSIFD